MKNQLRKDTIAQGVVNQLETMIHYSEENKAIFMKKKTNPTKNHRQNWQLIVLSVFTVLLVISDGHH